MDDLSASMNVEVCNAPAVSFEGTVRKAFSGQQTLLRHAEHCSLDPAQLAAMRLAIGRQLRVKRGDDDLAVYTVSEDRREPINSTVRMARTARLRLRPVDEDEEFGVTLEPLVPHPTMSDADAKRSSEFIERSIDAGTRDVIVLAPHGGAIERGTDRQAEIVQARLGLHRASLWLCRGYKRGGGAARQWHVTSSDIDDDSFPLLGAIARRTYTFAIAFHGFSEADVLVGGGAPRPIKRRVAQAIQQVLAATDIHVRIASASEPFDGNHPRNVVNRLTEAGIGGVQIEQSLAARDHYGESIAIAVANVYAEQLALL